MHPTYIYMKMGYYNMDKASILFYNKYPTIFKGGNR